VGVGQEDRNVAREKEPAQGEPGPEEDREAIAKTGARCSSVGAGSGPEENGETVVARQQKKSQRGKQDKGVVGYQFAAESNLWADCLAKGAAKEPTAVQGIQGAHLSV
jgi:hypothetical protein